MSEVPASVVVCNGVAFGRVRWWCDYWSQETYLVVEREAQQDPLGVWTGGKRLFFLGSGVVAELVRDFRYI